ncbi:MAG: hypothetical protein COU71_02785 [Parcubacteria group bacterium CG10_big_fil_rev_8_21_14_0_10_38_31]|nr:MAG: hypothetical protein COU71_02785 [Parcubacteria group bacterium CG10_big_fil_rev_8_21_14_0_10_38_31]
MVEIIPAILESDWREIENKINLVKDFSLWVQIDVSDGIFTPDTTWNNPSDLKTHLEASPPSEKISVEVDLMVKDPELVIVDWVDAGVRRVIIHIESTDDAGRAIKIAKEAGAETGLALNIDTPNEILDKYMTDIDFVQFMGIAKIGFQSQPFDEKVLHKIEGLRLRYPDAIISVDGGVNMKTVPLLAKVGVDRLVAGSAVYSSKDKVKNSWEELGNLANNPKH